MCPYFPPLQIPTHHLAEDNLPLPQPQPLSAMLPPLYAALLVPILLLLLVAAANVAVPVSLLFPLPILMLLLQPPQHP
jgi:hypothetical protein